jgi:hypothetical protein
LISKIKVLCQVRNQIADSKLYELVVLTQSGWQQVMPDDHSEVVPLLPIPNRTVKRLSADDSADSRVKVGHRQAITAGEGPAEMPGLLLFAFVPSLCVQNNGASLKPLRRHAVLPARSISAPHSGSSAMGHLALRQRKTRSISPSHRRRTRKRRRLSALMSRPVLSFAAR